MIGDCPHPAPYRIGAIWQYDPAWKHGTGPFFFECTNCGAWSPTCLGEAADWRDSKAWYRIAHEEAAAKAPRPWHRDLIASRLMDVARGATLRICHRRGREPPGLPCLGPGDHRALLALHRYVQDLVREKTRPAPLVPWPGIWVDDGPMLQPSLHSPSPWGPTSTGEGMNTLTIVIMALQSADAAIGLIEGFVTDQDVRKILDSIQEAIRGAVGALQPHQVRAQRAARAGEPVPIVTPEDAAPAQA